MLLPDLEDALEAWFRAQIPLPDAVGDVSFDSPDGNWGVSVNRPTVNLFLFDVARASRPGSILPAHRDRDGALVQAPPAPSVDFSYLLSAWGGGQREEHRLLGDALRVVLASPALVSDSPGLVAPVSLAMADPSHARARDLWGGLGGRLHAGMVLVVTTAVPLDGGRPVAPAVAEVDVEVRHPAPAAAPAASDDARSPARQGPRVLRRRARS